MLWKGKGTFSSACRDHYTKKFGVVKGSVPSFFVFLKKIPMDLSKNAIEWKKDGTHLRFLEKRA